MGCKEGEAAGPPSCDSARIYQGGTDGSPARLSRPPRRLDHLSNGNRVIFFGTGSVFTTLLLFFFPPP